MTSCLFGCVANAISYLITILLVCIPIYYVLRFLWELIPLGDKHKRAVFITGCDTGFGRLLAVKCAKNGVPAYVGCLTQKGADSLAEECNAFKENKVVAILLDVTSDESVEKAVRFVEQDLAKSENELFALVNNAGIFSMHGPDAWCTLDEYKSSVEVNLYGVIRCTHAFLPLLKQSKGRIISTSSVSGRVSAPFTAPYAVAKYGVQAYMDAIRLELHGYGVKCCILEPGIFRTDLVGSSAMSSRIDKIWSSLGSSLKQEYGEEFKNDFVLKWNKHMLENSSPQLHWVVDTYYHAITSRFPRLRYRCGWDSLFFYIPLCFLPTEVADAVVRFLVFRNATPPAVLMQKNKSE